MCVDDAELNAGAVPDVPIVKVCVPDVMPLIDVIPVAAGFVQVILVPLDVNTWPFVPTDVNPVPPFATATIPDTFDAVPDRVPVIILASKLPEPSLATMVLANLELVAEVALLLTFPGVEIVSNFESFIAVALHTPLVSVPTVVKLDVTTLLAKLVPVKFPAVILIVDQFNNPKPFVVNTSPFEPSNKGYLKPLAVNVPVIVLSPLNVVFPFFSTTIASLNELLLDPLPITNNLSLRSNELVLVGVYVVLYVPKTVSAKESAFVPAPAEKEEDAVAFDEFPNAAA